MGKNAVMISVGVHNLYDDAVLVSSTEDNHHLSQNPY